MSTRLVIKVLHALGHEATDPYEERAWHARADGFFNQPPAYKERWLNSCENLAADGVPWAQTFLQRYAVERLKE